MTKDNLRQTANLLSVLLALTVNILATALPLNNQTTAQISDRFKVFFVPAGYVFAIWGIIYIGWIAFAIYQFLPAHKESPRLRSLGYLFALTGVFNAAWLFCWQFNHFTLSVLVMLILLGLLIACYLKLNIGRTSVSNAEKLVCGYSHQRLSRLDQCCHHREHLGLVVFRPLEWIRHCAASLGCNHADRREFAWFIDGALAQGQRLPVRVCLGLRRDRRQTSRYAFGCEFRLGRCGGRIGTGSLCYSSAETGFSIISFSIFEKIKHN